LVQHTSKDAGAATSSTLAFATNNTSGNWIGVVIRAGNTGQVFTVTDSLGNAYKKAVQCNETVDGTTLGVFYAENIVGGANTITVSDTISGTLRFAILEYSGIAIANSLDVSVANVGSSSGPNTGNVITIANGDLLLAEMSAADFSKRLAHLCHTPNQLWNAELRCHSTKRCATSGRHVCSLRRRLRRQYLRHVVKCHHKRGHLHGSGKCSEPGQHNFDGHLGN
jgi:hypothetical protein